MIYKECNSYAKGGFCCLVLRITKCRDICNKISLCKYRIKCCLISKSHSKCLSFKKVKQK